MVCNLVPIFLLFLLLVLCPAAPAAAGPVTYFVFPLENQSQVPALGWIGEGVAVAVSEQMQTPGIATIGWEDRIRVIESSDLPPNTQLSHASMIRVAQRAGADWMVYGGYTGTDADLRITLRVLNLKSLRISGEKIANGPVAALPQLENELAWDVLSDAGNTGLLSRADFRRRTRVVPNQPYADYIGCLFIADEGARAARLLKILETCKDFPQASFLVGSYYYHSGDPAKAIQYLTPALREAQNLLETEFMLGACYLKQDKHADAIQAYNAFLARNQAMEAYNNLGVAYLRNGDYPLAIQNLVEARRLAKNDLTVRLNLALVRHVMGDEPAALAVLEDLVKTDPDQGVVQYLYAVVLYTRGQSAKADEAVAEAQKLGVDTDRMKKQDPRTWSWIFSTWTRWFPMLQK
jgi:tetratricopeptide (TPR) repeat protein